MVEAEVPSTAGPIDAPALILWGDRDVYCTRAAQEALLAAIPQARLVAYEGVGHCPHWERPEDAADAIAAFALRPPRAARATPARAG